MVVDGKLAPAKGACDDHYKCKLSICNIIKIVDDRKPPLAQDAEAEDLIALVEVGRSDQMQVAQGHVHVLVRGFEP